MIKIASKHISPNTINSLVATWEMIEDNYTLAGDGYVKLCSHGVPRVTIHMTYKRFNYYESSFFVMPIVRYYKEIHDIVSYLRRNKCETRTREWIATLTEGI